MIVAMPCDGAIIFSDLIGKLDMLRVSCETCGRDGCYGLARLIEKRGRELSAVDEDLPLFVLLTILSSYIL